MGSIWRLAGEAEFRRTKSMPERAATSSKVIGSAAAVAAAREIQSPAPVSTAKPAATGTA